MLSFLDILPSVKFAKFENISCFSYFSWEKKEENLENEVDRYERPLVSHSDLVKECRSFSLFIVYSVLPVQHSHGLRRQATQKIAKL